MSEFIATPVRRRTRVMAAHASPVLRVRRFGYVVLGVQFTGFVILSAIISNRFALTFDFAIYHQAWYLIAHGDLDPRSTITGIAFVREHSELYMWPAALLYWVWPHDVTLLWLQDACVVGAELVAFTWLCEIARRHRPDRDARWLIMVGLVLIVANPWIWWAVSWDFHTEPLAVLFAVLLLRDMAAGRRRAWVWVISLLACGDVACTYLAGAGLGGMLAGRRTRVPGAIMTGTGVGAVLLITVIHGNLGSGGGLHAYAYLAGAGTAAPYLGPAALAKGIATHPARVLRTLWAKRVDVSASLLPPGLIGVGYLPALPLVLVVLLAGELFQGSLFSQPSFQYLPVYVLLPVGSVAVLGSLMRRQRWIALVVAGLITAQAIGWALAWTPRIAGQWLRVPVPAARTLAEVEARIPASAHVLASQGVMGRFSSRASLRALYAPGSLPVSDVTTWVVVAPSAGIEVQSTASAMALLSELAGPLHASLITHDSGVWAFRWQPPAGSRSITIPTGSGPLPAWASPGAAGRDVLTGSAAGWHVAATGRKGYVADGLQWLKPTGQYQATVTLSSTGPVNVEVWDDTGKTLLARRSIPGTNGVQSISMTVNATTAYRASAYSGWGPFRADLLMPPPGQMLEVRVWSPGGEAVKVYRAQLIRYGI